MENNNRNDLIKKFYELFDDALKSLYPKPNSRSIIVNKTTASQITKLLSFLEQVSLEIFTKEDYYSIYLTLYLANFIYKRTLNKNRYFNTIYELEGFRSIYNRVEETAEYYGILVRKK